VVGYVLGRVDEEYQHEYISSSSSARPGRISSRRSLTVGHVTSLAVLPAFRKCGVGQSLMLSLQQQMSRCHSACRVNLHVRVSNLAAIRLYDALGYKTRHVVKAYYQVHY
jgi:ribosomal protein S18 acetylase RimI-like enzyme